MLSDEEFARRLRMARAHGTPDRPTRGLTQDEMGEALGGYNRNTISSWERAGIHDSQQKSMIKTVAEVTGLPEEFFFVDWSELERAFEIVPELDLRVAKDSLVEGARLLQEDD